MLSARTTVAPQPRVAPRRLAGASAETLLAGGVIGLAAGLPFVVTTRWYDYYYWPKIAVLYFAVGFLTLTALAVNRDRWLGVWRTPIGSALAAWLAVLTAATALSVNPLQSLVGEDYRYEGLLTWLTYGGLVALGACALATAARLRKLLIALLAAAAAMAVLGLLQRWGWTPVPEDVLRADLMRAMPRAWGTTGNPLALGAYLVLLLPVSISLYASEPAAWRRGLYAAGTILLYAALVATFARAAWGAMIVGVAVWAAATGFRRLREAAGRLTLLGALLIVTTFLVLARGPAGVRTSGPGAAGGGAMSVLAPSTTLAVHVSDRGTVAERLFVWRTTIPLVWRRPLLGWGPETLADIYPAYDSPELTKVFPEAGMQHLRVDRPHNDLLQQTVAAGFVGLAAYVWLWWTILRTTWQAARAPLVDPRLMAAGLLGGLGAYLAQLQLSFSYVSVAPVFWTLVGAAVALRRLSGGATVSDARGAPAPRG